MVEALRQKGWKLTHVLNSERAAVPFQEAMGVSAWVHHLACLQVGSRLPGAWLRSRQWAAGGGQPAAPLLHVQHPPRCWPPACTAAAAPLSRFYPPCHFSINQHDNSAPPLRPCGRQQGAEGAVWGHDCGPRSRRRPHPRHRRAAEGWGQVGVRHGRMRQTARMAWFAVPQAPGCIPAGLVSCRWAAAPCALHEPRAQLN